MLRHNRILATAALMAACAVPASSAAADPVPQPPDARDAAQHRGLYELDGRGYLLERDYGSPDAADAGRDLPAAPTVEISEPSGGFDWGDAGIGAAGMLALLSIAAGSVLLVSNRKRRRGFQPAAR